jgi:hypothetical protein
VQLGHLIVCLVSLRSQVVDCLKMEVVLHPLPDYTLIEDIAQLPFNAIGLMLLEEFDAFHVVFGDSATLDGQRRGFFAFFEMPR